MSAVEKVTARRLEWLGHLARMPDNRIPKRCLFGWLPQARPRGGPRKRWRDVIRADLRTTKVSEDDWYELATTSRQEWRALYREALDVMRASDAQGATPQALTPTQVECQECGRTFRRGDRKRHKCTWERQKPVREQQGAVQCETCLMWFRSRGGLAVHRCRSDTS